VRLVLVVTQGAAKLALLLSTGGLLAAVPAAWRFVRQVIAEVRQLRRARAP
jgi:hypothetical protein